MDMCRYFVVSVGSCTVGSIAGMLSCLGSCSDATEHRYRYIRVLV